MDNLIFILNQIVIKDITPGIYNIADDESISTNRLIQLISESSGKKLQIWKLNKNIVKGIAKFGDILNLPLNSERLEKLTESYQVSNEKLKKALNINKMPVSSEEGMKKTLMSF